MALSSVGAFAQYSAGDITIQPKVGLNIANVTNFQDSKTRAGVAAGAEFEYHASPLVGISAGVLYSMQGFKYEGKFKDIKGNYTIKNDYINIPILANVYVVEGLALKAGVQPGFKVSSKVESDGYSKDLDDTFKSFDFAIPVGLSYEYANICLDARYNIGVTKIIDADNSGRNSVFQITLGYKFKL